MMNKIHLIIDTSGSMSVLGKPEIIKTSKACLLFLSRFDESFNSMEFEELLWTGETEELSDILDKELIKKVLIFSDGYYDKKSVEAIITKNRESGKNIQIVYCGSDAIIRRDFGVEAKDILKALEKVLDLYEK